MDINRILSEIVHERMKTVSELDALRFLTEVRGERYNSLINILLDKLNNLNRIEKELTKELKSKKNNNPHKPVK
jgi:hypothetical protein